MKLLLIIFLVTGNYVNAQSLELGKKQLYYGRLVSAVASFREAIRQDPQNGEGWFNLVKAYFLLGQPGKGCDTLLKAPVTVSEDPFFRVAEGLRFLHNNSRDQAISYFDNILKAAGKRSVELIPAIAWIQINSPEGDADYAIGRIQSVMKKKRHNPELLVLLGDAWRKKANGSEAFKAYQEAVNEDPAYAAAYFKMGQIFLSQKNVPVYTDYFQKAVTADPEFSPAWYRLYIYQFSRNPDKAMSCYANYLQNADYSVQNIYDMTDLLYLTGQYDSAISHANSILRSQRDSSRPRIYKLIAYSYAGKRDTLHALTMMQTYFENETDSNLIAKDYEALSSFHMSIPGHDSLAAVALSKATALEKDSTILWADYKKLAEMAKVRRDYNAQAFWLGKYCRSNPAASNLDLFYWGIANYRIEDYRMADSVFGLYIQKFPAQSFGYYWQAKSKALQDTGMVLGLAVPVYEKLIEVLNGNPADENYKKWITEAYGYLAAYAVNSRKDYPSAMEYFRRLLAIDPDNALAKKYVDMLDKRMNKMTKAPTDISGKSTSE
ncbi:MAG: hypothetical protein QM764_20515 [Chitinophagaceae bacterium]